MQLFFKEHFQPIVFQKLKDWKLERCCMKDDTWSPRPPPKISLKHDHIGTEGNDQSGSTVEHQPVRKLVQQSLGEAIQAGSPKPTQSKPKPICERTGKPVETEAVFVEKGKTSHSQEIVGKRLQEELGSSDRTGKPVKCEYNRVMNVHDRTGKPVESSTHTQCKNLILPDIVILHRQTRTSSTLRSMRKTSTSTYQVCRTRWWNDHMALTFTTWFSRSRTTLNDKHFKVIFNNTSIQSFQQRVNRCDYGCWEHWTMRDNRRGAEITVQSMLNALEHRNCVLHMWTPLARWYNRKQEVYLVRVGSLLYPELFHQEGPATRSQVREERRLQRIPHGKTTSKEESKETLRKHSRSIYPWQVVQKDDDQVGSLWRSHPWNGSTCKRRPQSYCHTRRN